MALLLLPVFKVNVVVMWEGGRREEEEIEEKERPRLKESFALNSQPNVGHFGCFLSNVIFQMLLSATNVY